MPQPDSLFSTSSFAAGCLAALPAAWRASSPVPPASPHPVQADFLGVCVAPSDAPEGDDFLIDALRQAGLRNVRLDLTYAHDSGPAGRLLRRLLDADFRVWIHLVQPWDEAARMPAAEAVDRWTAFTRDLFQTYRGRVAVFEVGATVNRRKWTGYSSLDAFLRAWEIAWREARSAGVTLAGVNVTDFEPFYNAGLLEILKRRGLLPAIHSDNLFAERATEPERFDPKILGPRLAGVARFNLIRKARLLDALARRFGILETVCTHTAWSARRIRRLLDDAEQKQADYLARYLLLAAASGALSRVYWGPFIGQREGLIDDGTAEYPDPVPHVTFYGRAPGNPARYRFRPAFHALRALAGFLPGSTWSRRLAAQPGVELVEFQTPRGLVHAGWTVNGKAADLRQTYAPDSPPPSRILDRDGRTVSSVPSVLTESPVYFFWDSPSMPSVSSAPSILSSLTVPHPHGRRFEPVSADGWTGFVALPDAAWPADGRLAPYFPMALEGAADSQVLRQARNRVWKTADPLRPGETMVVKRACATAWHKRLLGLGRPSKARRSWNCACELLRRGVATPEPIAFFEQPVRHPALAPSYYLCRAFPGTDSVRTAFTAFRDGAKTFEGLDRAEFYKTLADFLGRMHERGAFHRDLSAGNVLVRVCGSRAEFSVIDTGRARFYPHPLPLSLRMADLKRICHPLSWPERKVFVGLYLARLNRSFAPALQWPFALYDLKHRCKQWLRPLRGKR